MIGSFFKINKFYGYFVRVVVCMSLFFMFSAFFTRCSVITFDVDDENLPFEKLKSKLSFEKSRSNVIAGNNDALFIEALKTLNGDWIKGLVSKASSGVKITIDADNRELYYQYSLSDFWTYPVGRDPVLNFYITDWVGMEKRGDRVQFYGKIRYGSYKYGAIGNSKHRQVIRNIDQRSVKDVKDELKKLPPGSRSGIPSIYNPKDKDAIYAFVSIKEISENSYDIFIWGGPDVTANKSGYQFKYISKHPKINIATTSSETATLLKKYCPPGNFAKLSTQMTSYMDLKNNCPFSSRSSSVSTGAKLPMVKSTFYVVRSWVGFSDTVDNLKKESYDTLKDFPLKYGRTTHKTYTRVK